MYKMIKGRVVPWNAGAIASRLTAGPDSVAFWHARRAGWLLILFLLLTACLPSSEDFANQSPLLAALERKSGLIVYVGADGNIYTINQGGGDKNAITSDADLPVADEPDKASRIYLHPTWSADSRRVAFAGLSGTSEEANAFLYAAAPDGSELEELYRSEFTQPIYLYWSPDNENLTFLASTEAGGLLLQMVSVKGGPPLLLDEGAPFYWAWHPGGERMLIHAGGSGTEARLSFLFPQEPVIEEGLDIRPTYFQAPAWQPGGDLALLTAEGKDGENELVLLGPELDGTSKLADLEDGSVAFAWSPDGRKVAYVTGDQVLTQGALGTLKLFDLDQPDQRITAGEEEQVFAFFWSPDSKKIAYFVPRRVPVASDGGGADGEDGEGEETVIVLDLHILDAASGASERIAAFQPTAQFLGILPYFDQYHRSSTIWSPDSQNLVIAGYDGEGPPGILVLHSSGELEPRRIDDGTLAFWSWE